ncbi:MAG: ABC transporter permease [Terracidiphilus sp.]|jgi:peptide/nickel transport system permease protein
MGAYASRRLLWAAVTIILTSMVVFLLLRFIPGNVLDIIQENLAANGGGPIDRAAISKLLGLNVPVYVQYARWVTGIVFHGNLGSSLMNSRPLTPLIVQRIPLTFELCLMSLIIVLIISIPIGIYAAIRQDTILDRILRSFAIILMSVPNFVIAAIITFYVFVWWHYFTPLVFISIGKDPLGNLGMMIMPALALGSQQTGGTMRVMRTMMLETLRQDYIRTAWAKGLKERVVVIRHALKNALIPVITMVGGWIPILIGGSVIIEYIFNLPGVGRLLFDALNQRDYPMISAITLILSVIVVLSNLLVDLAYGWLDPRIHYQ